MILVCVLSLSDVFGAGNPLVYRKGDEDPVVDVFELPQREYETGEDVHRHLR